MTTPCHQIILLPRRGIQQPPWTADLPAGMSRHADLRSAVGARFELWNWHNLKARAPLSRSKHGRDVSIAGEIAGFSRCPFFHGHE